VGSSKRLSIYRKKNKEDAGGGVQVVDAGRQKITREAEWKRLRKRSSGGARKLRDAQGKRD